MLIHFIHSKLLTVGCCCSVSKLCPTFCDFHGLQHTKLPCPSPCSAACSNSCPLLSNHLILCHPLLLRSTFPNIRVISSESAVCIRWPKYQRFSISPSNEYFGLISFRIDWSGLLAVQGTLKSFLWHHNLKASILLCSAFFMVQLSHSYMITGKTIALTIWTFAGEAVSVLFNTQCFSQFFFQGV